MGWDDSEGLQSRTGSEHRSIPMPETAKQPSTGFAQFNLHPNLMRGIQNAGFENPRPIQAATLPAALKGDDILGLAQTGTGKTAGFAIPILERITRNPGGGPTALILAPTRELASQIAEEIRTLASYTRVRGVTIYGGVGQRRQVTSLRKRPDIIVACPGRLLDLMGQGFVQLGNIQMLVLDEADHMFDMGFLVSIRKIIKHLPRKRQNLLFSATMPKEIRKLAEDMLKNPTVVELPSTKPVDLIEQVVYRVHHRRKVQLTEHLLKNDDVSRAIIFTRTKRGAKALAAKLERASFNAASLQGNMSQNARERVMRGFKSGTIDILVATDIAARGIDVSKVSHVINYDVPDTPEAYTHRIGRTGRAECTGKACTFITSEDHQILRAIERRIDQKIPQEIVEEFQTCDDPNPRSRPQRQQRRGSSSGSRNQGRSRRKPAPKRAQATATKRDPASTETRPAQSGQRPAQADKTNRPSRKPKPASKPATGGDRPRRRKRPRNRGGDAPQRRSR